MNDMETKENCCGNDHKWHNGWSVWRCIGVGILGAIGFVVFAFLFGAVIMWLRNCLVPNIFHLTTITFWQAVGLAVLARLIFGGFHHGMHHGRHMHGRHRHWRNSHNSKDCGCSGDRWHHYDEYWQEEGEKAFADYVKRKSENQ